jgi:hypothetical protein
MSHADATLCMSVPTFDANWAKNSARKIACRRGLHGESGEGVCELRSSLIARNPTHPWVVL